MLRGVAARLSGNALMRGGNEDGALGLYQDSLALLEKIGCPLEAAKTRLALASLALRRNDKEKAVLLVSDAWPMYDCLKDFFLAGGTACSGPPPTCASMGRQSFLAGPSRSLP